MKQAAAKDVIKVVATNRRATHDFHVHERIEAGIVLVGSEVKSLREAKVTLTDGFAQVAKGEVWLEGMTINEYAWANRFNHEVRRRRKLLLHKDEIKKLTVKTQLRGYTLVPLSLYFTDGKVKVELALARGKQAHDKRQDLARRDAQREVVRELGRRAKGMS